MAIKELEKVFVELVSPNLILISIKSGFELNAEDILLIKDHNLSIMKNKSYGLVVDAKYYTSVSAGARKAMATSATEKNRKATGIVIYEFPQRILGNIFIWFNRPKVPTKLFSNKEDAIDWVKTHLNQ